jgi:hypothetical protein
MASSVSFALGSFALGTALLVGVGLVAFRRPSRPAFYDDDIVWV